MDTNKDLVLQYTLKVTECPCGSGRVPDKCCGPVKPRIHKAILDLRNYTESEGIAIGLDHSLKRIIKGELLPIIGDVTFEQSYVRNKGNKVLVRGHQDNHWAMDPNGILLAPNHLFVIDTNSMDMHGHKVSVSCVLYAHKGANLINYTPLAFFEFWSPAINPEKLGWFTLISAIERNSELSAQEIGIVVDSFLAQLTEFNNGNSPYAENAFLPKNIKLIYASADLGNKIANKLIRLCDRKSKEVLEWRKENPDFDTLYESKHYPCERWRQLVPRRDDPSWKVPD